MTNSAFNMGIAKAWKNYGLPYKGSKNRIVQWLGDNLPPGNTFVDLFCGGCSVTHYMMTQRRYKNYIINDLNPMMPEAFIGAVRGMFHDERRWIGREDFFRLKDTDPYAALCFSFGNDMRSYAYATKIEKFKRACHEAIVFNEYSTFGELMPDLYGAVRKVLSSKELLPPFSERSAFHQSPFEDYSTRQKVKAEMGSDFYDYNTIPLKLLPARRMALFGLIKSNKHISAQFEKKPSLRSLQSLQSLESLERFERLERLQRLQRRNVTAYSKDYQSVPIPAGSVVYCDIPYINTNAYKVAGVTSSFDHGRFYQWALTRDFPVFVSEYTMPGGFACIAATKKSCSMNKDAPKVAIERMFVQRRFAETCRWSLFAEV